MAGWRKLFEALPDPVKRAARRAVPSAELMRLDRGAFSAWRRHVDPVGQALGDPMEVAYTELVLVATRKEGRLGRQMGWSVPENLARVQAQRREEYLRLLRLVVERRPQAAAMVARTLPELMEKLGGGALARFLGTGVDLHEDSAKVAESFLKGESERAQDELERLAQGLPLKDVARTLALYARAHCGEDVQVRAAPPQNGQRNPAFTEGRHLWLPERVDRYGDERDFTVYRVLTARTAGYLEFGTFDLRLERVPGAWPEQREGETDLERLFRAFPNRSLARDIFQIAEDARVERRLREEYPGVARDIDKLRPEELLLRPELQDMAPVEQLVEAFLRRSWGADPGVEGPVRAAVDRVAEALLGAQRVDEVAAGLARAYAVADGLLTKVKDEDLNRPENRERPPGNGGRGQRGQEPGTPDPYKPMEDTLTGSGLRPDALTEEQRAEEQQIREVQDSMAEQGLEATLTEIRRAMKHHPDRDGRSYDDMVAFLERMPPPDGGLVEEGEEEEEVQAPLRGPPQEALEEGEGASFRYPEWDAGIQDSKPDWVRVREYTLAPGDRDFVRKVLDEHGDAIRALRRRFEALRPQDLARVKGQPDGDELDIDRVIEARVARRAGTSPPERLYVKHLRARRDVAVAFLLDMSSSTNEASGDSGRRIIEVEKEALVMMGEAVEAIGDASAIWGFSGYGRQSVAFYIAKDFDDAWGESVRERIGKITWKMENRDGAAIRHATHKLLQRRARTRLLVLISDGRPLDCGCDQYFDAYAHEDTRVALREARQAGVHPFCITVDPRGRKYLEDLYGEVGYTVIERAETLPERLPAIYRRLTR